MNISSIVRPILYSSTSIFLFNISQVEPQEITPPKVSKSCLSKINEKYVGWKFEEISDNDIYVYANSQHFNPVVAYGDFDGDGRKDQALLIKYKEKTIIAVCFKLEDKTKIVVIENPYCGDYIFTRRAGQSDFNFNTNKTEILKRDGVSVSCFEKAGATYEYEHGKFTKIVDDD